MSASPDTLTDDASSNGAATPVATIPDDGIELAGITMPIIMPHRFRMMLVDKVASYRIEERELTSVKNVAQNDPLLEGHFTDFPIFPGALMVEAMAQTCGALMNLESMRKDGADMTRLNDRPYLRSLLPIPMTVLVDSKIKQHEVALPGDQVIIDTDLTLQHGDMCYYKVTANTRRHRIASGEIMLAYADELM